MVPASRASFSPSGCSTCLLTVDFQECLRAGSGEWKTLPLLCFDKGTVSAICASPGDSESHCQDVPGIVLINPGDMHYYSHCTDEETEAGRKLLASVYAAVQ